MKFSPRQLEIIQIVKGYEPISGDEIGKQLGLSKATLRSDLAILTMVGILDARPKVGYFYTGQMVQPMLFDELYQKTVEEIMVSQMAVNQEMSIYDAVVTLFMYDVGSLYVTDDKEELVGIISRKDLLRATINNTKLATTPIAVIMTRSPNLITVTKEMSILDVGYLFLQHKIDSVPVVDSQNQGILLGKVTKTTLTEYFIQSGLDIAEKSGGV